MSCGVGMDEEIDISLMEYSEWLAFAFDHPVSANEGERWHHRVSVPWRPAEPRTLLGHFTGLCKNFRRDTRPYTVEQVDQGVWFLMGAGGANLSDYLFNRQIPFAERVECVRSMLGVFTHYVTSLPDDAETSCFYMWWDLVASQVEYAVGDGNEPNEDQLQVREAIFETLLSILRLGNEYCQVCALHGLGHLAHPRRAEAVQEYLDRRAGRLTSEQVEWIEACRDGTVM